jgi:hypothetical protein
MGSTAYFDKHWDDKKNIIGALCLCGVGEDQEKCKSSLFLTRTPDSIPSFINDLMEHLIREISKGKLLHSGHIRTGVQPYSPFSDNIYFNLYGVPCILLSSKPNLYFHTQYLTANKMDPEVFETSGSIVFEAAYRIANAGFGDALEFANIVAEAADRRLGEISVKKMGEFLKLTKTKVEEKLLQSMKELEYILDRDLKAIDSIKRVLPFDENLKKIFNVFISRLKECLISKSEEEKKKLKTAATNFGIKIKYREKSQKFLMKPIKVEKVDPSIQGLSYEEQNEMIQKMKEVDGSFTGSLLGPIVHEIYLYANGENTIQNISDKIEIEYGVRINPDNILTLENHLHRTGSVAHA